MFVLVASAHFSLVGLFPERDPAQDLWVSMVPVERSWFRSYLEAQSYWLGYSYAIALSFATATFRRYRERKQCTDRNLAIGGVTFSGFLAVAGCFLIGCCGSPMLAVYVSLFGASFLPLARPLVALITTATVLAGWVWMNRRVAAVEAAEDQTGPDMDCACS